MRASRDALLFTTPYSAADMNKRPQTMLKPLLVVNMDVKDNAEEASLAAPQALKLCSMVRNDVPHS